MCIGHQAAIQTCLLNAVALTGIFVAVGQTCMQAIHKAEQAVQSSREDLMTQMEQIR